jgi:hypothetical protein
MGRRRDRDRGRGIIFRRLALSGGGGGLGGCGGWSGDGWKGYVDALRLHMTVPGGSWGLRWCWACAMLAWVPAGGLWLDHNS